jgi:PAS domain S-box-containing protein
MRICEYSARQPRFIRHFSSRAKRPKGRLLYDLGNGQWNRPRLRELLGSALFNSEPFHDFEVEHDFAHIGRRTMRLNARRIPRRDPQQKSVLLAIEDVTERREIAEIDFSALFETAKDGMVVVEVETGTVQDVNPFFLRLTGFQREDFIGKSARETGDLLRFPEFTAIVAETRESEIVRHDDLQFTGRQGKEVTVEIVANRYVVGSQPVVQLNIRDISARKEADRALRESEEQFRLVVESVRDYAIFQMDHEGKIVTWNAGAGHVLGWEEREILGKDAAVIFTPEDVANGEHIREFETARLEGRASDERWHVRKDGSRFFATGVLARVPERQGERLRFTKVMQNITRRKEQEDQLRRSLEEKSGLVREIHHRVKNNLQMIVSLLSLHASHADNPELTTVFEETEGRVRAIARIHERLYASDDLTTVEIGGYLTGLARELIAIHAISPDGRTLHVQTEHILMHIEKAIPVGLIANELILNSLKHGLPAGIGDLTVKLSSVQTDGSGRRAELLVEDSGPGLPANLVLSEAESMGYQLIHLLVRQLRGDLQRLPGPGARIAIRFPLALD